MKTVPIILAILLVLSGPYGSGFLLAASTPGREQKQALPKPTDDELKAGKVMTDFENKCAELAKGLVYYKNRYDRASNDLALLNRAQLQDEKLIAGTWKDLEYYQAKIESSEAELAQSKVKLAKAKEDLQKARVAERKDDCVIVPGDVFMLFVEGLPELNGLYQVRREGFINLPKAGKVKIEGKTMIEAERIIQSVVEPFCLHPPSVKLERSRWYKEEEK
jgi:hypothetical protein